MTKPVPPVPEENQSQQGPGSAPSVPLESHRDDEKNNIRDQAEHGNMTQNASNRRSG